MIVLVVGALILVIDQGIKYYVTTNLILNTSIPVINDVFYVTYISNAGAAFGLLEDQVGLLSLIMLFLVVIIVYLCCKTKSCCWQFHLGIGAVSGGGGSNLLDRMTIGYVVDFLDMRNGPVFNVADVAILSGVCFLVSTIIFSAKRESVVRE